MNYNVLNWYWLAADGRIFSSAVQSIIPAQNANYVNWLAAGNIPTPWPKDDTGTQTSAALQWVFDNAGVDVFVDLASYAAYARYNKEISGTTVNGKPVDTTDRSQMTIGNAWALLQASGATSIQFKYADGSYQTMTSDQFKSLALAVGGYVQLCRSTEATIDAAITAGTITTAAQVDAAFAAQ